jgi:hypothetical protein
VEGHCVSSRYLLGAECFFPLFFSSQLFLLSFIQKGVIFFFKKKKNRRSMCFQRKVVAGLFALQIKLLYFVINFARQGFFFLNKILKYIVMI